MNDIEDITESASRVAQAIRSDAARLLEQAANATPAEARAMLSRFLTATEFKPMVGVRANGNVALAQYPAVLKEIANVIPVSERSEIFDDNQIETDHHDRVRRHSEKIFSAAIQAEIDDSERRLELAHKRNRDQESEAWLWGFIGAGFLFGLSARLQNAAIQAYDWSKRALGGVEMPLPTAQGEFSGSAEAKAHAAQRKPFLDEAAQGVKNRLKASLERGVAGGESPGALGRRLEEGLRHEAEVEGKVIAETESQIIYGITQDLALKAAGYSKKRWLSVGDERVRDSHVACDAQGAIAIGNTFSNGLRFPGDPLGPIAETINCRCFLVGE